MYDYEQVAALDLLHGPSNHRSPPPNRTPSTWKPHAGNIFAGHWRVCGHRAVQNLVGGG